LGEILDGPRRRRVPVREDEEEDDERGANGGGGDMSPGKRFGAGGGEIKGDGRKRYASLHSCACVWV